MTSSVTKGSIAAPVQPNSGIDHPKLPTLSMERCSPRSSHLSRQTKARSVAMRAAVVTDLIGPDGVVVREVPVPTPGPAQVLIDVEYAGISFPDVLQTRGQYQVRPELPFTPGWE